MIQDVQFVKSDPYSEIKKKTSHSVHTATWHYPPPETLCSLTSSVVFNNKICELFFYKFIEDLFVEHCH